MASLSEGKGKNYGRKGGQGSDKPVRITPFDRREARANIQDPSRSNNPADVVRRFFNVKDEPGTVSSNVSRDELLKRLESQTNQRLSKSAQAAADIADVEPDAARIRNQAGEVAQRSRETKPPQRRPLADTTKGGPVTTMRLGDPGAPSKEAARTLQRMKDADPTTAARLQANLRASDTRPKPEPKPAAPKPETIKQSDVSQRAARFRQSFGTPTGADPKTGRPTYKPLDSLTNLPKGRGGTAPSPEQYAKVQVGDLDTKRLVRTQGPQGTPTKRGVENFLLNRETKGALGGRNARRVSPEQGKAALERVKGFMADPKEVSKVAAQIKQEVGGRRAQLENPPARPSRSSAASTASTTAVRRVRVQDLTPQPSAPAPRPTTSRAPQLPAATKQPAATPTVTKVKQALNLSIAKQPPAPEPSFKVSGTTKQTTAPQLPSAGSTARPEPVKQSTVSQRAQTYRAQVNPPEPPRAPSTAGQNLEFGKTKSGSFTYKPSTPSTATAQQVPPKMEPLPEPAAPTRRRASGDAGPSSKLSSAPRPPATSTTPQTASRRRQNILPDLGRGSTTIRSGQSTTLKPRPATPTKQSDRGLGAVGNLAYGGFQGYDAYQKAIAAGKSQDVAIKRGLARGGGTSAGAAIGGKIGKSVGGALASRIGLRPAGSFVGDLVGSTIGGMVGGDAATAAMGIDKKDRDWMRWANRKVQTGIPAQSAQSRTGSTSVIRDRSGKERVGYLAYKDGNQVFKTANDPSSLKYTSSNPLERIGRTIASGGYGPVSDWLKSRYTASDDATRRAKVAAQKARAGNK